MRQTMKVGMLISNFLVSFLIFKSVHASYDSEIVYSDDEDYSEESFEPLDDDFAMAFSAAWNTQSKIKKLPVRSLPRSAPLHDLNTVELAIVIFQPGNRNPKRFIESGFIEKSWGKEGPGQLTKVGVTQATFLGKSMQDRYKKLLPGSFHMRNFRAISSENYPEQMTMQAFTMGLFHGSRHTTWRPLLDLQPVPITTDNTMLSIDKVKECVTVQRALKPIFKDKLPELRDWIRRESTLANYVSRYTGIPESLGELAEVAKNIHEMKIRNVSFPTWAEDPLYPDHNKEDLYLRLQQFKNVHEIACSKYRKCRSIVGGMLLHDILERFKSANNGSSDGVRMVAYSADLMTVLSTMQLLNFDYLDVPDNGGIIIEFRKFPVPAVRFLYHEPDEKRPEFRKIFVADMADRMQKICPADWCPIEYFLGEVERYAIPDFRVACGMNSYCDVKLRNREPNKNLMTLSLSPLTTEKPDEGLKCAEESNQSPAASCIQWARHGYCGTVEAVRFLFCRRSCLCEKFTVVNDA